MLRNVGGFHLLLLGVGVVLLAALGGHLLFRGLERYPVPPEWEVDGGDPERGRLVIAAYGCGACHRIDGIRSADGRAGPPLEDLRERIYLAGQLPNSPEHLVLWIMHPQRIARGTAMPDLGVSEAEARDIAAYLYAAD